MENEMKGIVTEAEETSPHGTRGEDKVRDARRRLRARTAHMACGPGGDWGWSKGGNGLRRNTAWTVDACRASGCGTEAVPS
eukprot:6192273-Pleurochrysis_carterae.AAC.2